MPQRTPPPALAERRDAPTPRTSPTRNMGAAAATSNLPAVSGDGRFGRRLDREWGWVPPPPPPRLPYWPWISPPPPRPQPRDSALAADGSGGRGGVANADAGGWAWGGGVRSGNGRRDGRHDDGDSARDSDDGRGEAVPRPDTGGGGERDICGRRKRYVGPWCPIGPRFRSPPPPILGVASNAPLRLRGIPLSGFLADTHT